MDQIVDGRHHGFTLIEVIVTVAMIAILASIAIPSYRHYIVRNAEYEAQSQMKQLEIELSRWLSKNLTYKNFQPMKSVTSGGAVTYGYDGTDNNFLYSPKNSDQNTYRYQIFIVDGSSNKSLIAIDEEGTVDKEGTVDSVTGRSWKMFAIPNSSLGTAHKLMLSSSGVQCKAKNSDSSVTIASTNCGTYSETW